MGVGQKPELCGRLTEAHTLVDSWQIMANVMVTLAVQDASSGRALRSKMMEDKHCLVG